jgi:hypothetical protein
MCRLGTRFTLCDGLLLTTLTAHIPVGTFFAWLIEQPVFAYRYSFGRRTSEYQHYPPCVSQHHQNKHTQEQALIPACLPVSDAPVFYGPIEFFFYPFHKIQSLL